jgi:hypothetical protein
MSERLAGPDDPIYREPLQSYSPHWAQGLLKAKKTSPQRGVVAKIG